MNYKQFEELGTVVPQAVKLKIKGSSGKAGYPAVGKDCNVEITDINGNVLKLDVKDLTLNLKGGYHPVLATFTVNVSELDLETDAVFGLSSAKEL